jgi:hypothetical protein
MSKPTDTESIKTLLAEVNSLGALMIATDGDDSSRKLLIDAAEKLIIAARTPGENLYLTTAQVGLCNSRKCRCADIDAAVSQRINKCCLQLGMLRLHPRSCR